MRTLMLVADHCFFKLHRPLKVKINNYINNNNKYITKISFQINNKFCFLKILDSTMKHSRWLSGKQSTCWCRRMRKCGFNPLVGKIPWRRKWQCILVFLPGYSMDRGLQLQSLSHCSPWGQKELEMTEWLSTHNNDSVNCIQFSSVTQSCPTLCDPMHYSMPAFPVHHQLLELTQTHIYWVSDAI